MSKRTRRNLADPLRFWGGDHSLRRCGHEEWRDWAGLPSELIDDVAGRLLRYDVAEYLRLRAACKEWRDRTAADPRGGGNMLDSRFRPRRWIMLSNNTDGARRRFLNLATGACAQVDLPELSDHHLETSTEGFLVLRDKASDAIRLLNPLTRALTDLPTITVELRSMSPTSQPAPCSCILYAGISDETSPATVVLFMRGGTVWNIAYAKPGDERWALMDDEGWKLLPSPRILEDGNACKYVRYVSAMTLRGRVYFPTYEGNILKVRVHPKPRLVPVINNQAFDVLYNNVTSYLVPADDDHRRMLMVRDYGSLRHLSETEQRSIKRRKNTDVIKLEYSSKPRLYSWHLIQVFKVDLAGKRLAPAVDIGRRAVFVGDVACVSLSTKTFPSVAGNAVYLAVNSSVSPGIGVRHLGDKGIELPYEFRLEDGSKAFLYGWRRRPGPGQKAVVPLARPCSLQEYLICCAGIKGGIKD